MVTAASPSSARTACGAVGTTLKTPQTKLAVVAVAPALSVTVTRTALNVCAELVIVPVIRPVLLIPSVAGPLTSV